MLELFIPLLRNMTLITAVAILYTVTPKRLNRIPDSVVIGAICGLGACLAMLDPVQLRPGVFTDSRSTMVLLAGLFGGPLGGAISTVLAGGLRIYFGGAGMLPGTLSIVLSGAIGVGVYLWYRGDGRPVAMSHLLVLAALSPLPYAAIFVLPWQAALDTFAEIFLPGAILRVAGVLLLGVLLIHERRRVAAEDRIRELAGVDELSGLANRRSFYRGLERAIERHRVHPFDFSVVLIDLDHFKSINDRYGHQVGDEVIRTLAGILKANTRGGDVAARIGGEEFAVLLSGANRDQANRVCERIRNSIAERALVVGAETVPFTASLGIATSTSLSRSANALMSAADGALYLAKKTGRNRVVSEAFQ